MVKVELELEIEFKDKDALLVNAYRIFEKIIAPHDPTKSNEDHMDDDYELIEEAAKWIKNFREQTEVKQR